MKDIELLPCPFCGNDAETVDDLVTLHVECCHCGATGGVSSHKRGAVESWNRRVAVEANSVPYGWKPVPVEPTEEMLHCGPAPTNDAEKFVADMAAGYRKEIWTAMLSASPAPAQQERKPMTDEMAASDYFGRSEAAANPENRTFTNGSFECFLGGIRFAERHHGIFAEPAQDIKE